MVRIILVLFLALLMDQKHSMASSLDSDYKGTSQGTADTLEMITERMQSLSRSLENMPTPPELMNREIQIPEWKKTKADTSDSENPAVSD